MSSFLYRLGRWCFRHGAGVLVGWLVVLAVVGGLGAATMGKFNNSFDLPGTQSQDALDQLRMTFPEMAGTSATMVVVAPPERGMDDPEVEAAIEAAVAEIGDLDFIASAQSPYFEMVDGMVSADRSAGLASIMLQGTLTDFTEEQKTALVAEGRELEQELPGSTVRMGGEAFNASIPELTFIEAVGVGVALVVLVLTMGSLVAAIMPLVTALVAVGITMGLVLAATGVMDVNSTTPMLALMLGLAVGIDYALFILARHREQLGEGLGTEESAARAVATSGSAVVFAGMTVFIALVGLFVAGIPFLTTMGLAAALGIAIAVAVALTLVPAMAGMAGERMRPRPSRRARRRADVARESHDPDHSDDPHEAARLRMRAVAEGRGGGPSGWWVRTVTRRPLLTVVIVVLALGALALPARDMQLALPNAGQNKAGTSSREAYDLIAENFGPGYNGTLVVTAEIIASTDPLGVMDGLRADIEAMPGVELVAIATPNRTADTGIVQVIPTTGPDDPTTELLVQRLRQAGPGWEDEYGARTAVTGYTAVAIDVSDRLGAALLPFGIFVVGLSLVLLTMVFRSLVVPIKATLGYLLSVLAAFGATTLVFTHGVGANLVNVEILGPIISFLPIITMGILFGLSMDYEVFLVSRMREDHVHGMPARAAVHTGFVGSAIVVVAAAVIMVSVFAFFVPESDRGSLQPIAFALTVGVAIDAFVVRMTLVPAVMALLGERAWWLPRWLDRRLPSFDVEGTALADELALQDWPGGEPAALVAEGLVAGESDLALHAPVDLRLPPGGRLLVTGEPHHRSALLLCLAGRLPAAAGRARVGGELLEHAARVRRRVTHLDLRRTPDAMERLARLAADPGDPGRVVVLDDADAASDRETRALIVELVRNSASAVVVGALDERGLVPILPFDTPRLEVRPADDSAAARPDPQPALAMAGAPAPYATDDAPQVGDPR